MMLQDPGDGLHGDQAQSAALDRKTARVATLGPLPSHPARSEMLEIDTTGEHNRNAKQHGDHTVPYETTSHNSITEVGMRAQTIMALLLSQVGGTVGDD
jgi:hypothetical protein